MQVGWGRERGTITKPRRNLGPRAVLLLWVSSARPGPLCQPAAPCQSHIPSPSSCTPGGIEVVWVALLYQSSLTPRSSSAGCGKGYTDTVLKGSLEEQKFLIFYLK